MAAAASDTKDRKPRVNEALDSDDGGGDSDTAADDGGRLGDSDCELASDMPKARVALRRITQKAIRWAKQGRRLKSKYLIKKIR